MKIVDAVRAMIARRDLISEATPGKVPSEMFFLFDRTHKWSILRGRGTMSLFYYSTVLTIADLANLDEYEWEDFRGMMSYHGRDYGDEFEALLQELSAIVQNLEFGIEDALDSIIKRGSSSA